MELCNQMKKYRNEQGLSQDALAEKIFVSRQTISNWETGKNYPDINSLLRMSEVFGITVDVLLKGDAQEIKNMIKKEDQTELHQLGWLYTGLMLLMIATPVPLVKFLKFWGLCIWGALAAITIGVAVLVEKKKKALNIQTYREIVAFLEGKHLDEIEAAREEGKRPYQIILLAIGAGMLALIVSLLLEGLLS